MLYKYEFQISMLLSRLGKIEEISSLSKSFESLIHEALYVGLIEADMMAGLPINFIKHCLLRNPCFPTYQLKVGIPHTNESYK